jgi:protein-L-isoaspartate(D-aspartate) O-methyltransferase
MWLLNFKGSEAGGRQVSFWGGQKMDRRRFLALSSGALALGVATRASANVPVAYDWDAGPPMNDRAAYIAWMVKNRGEDPQFLGQRYDRFLQLISHHDVWDDRNKRAYLMTPREAFVTKANLDRAYEWHYLDIGFGVTITGPHTVARMTNVIDVKQGDKVLEIGTGSGYQSAYLSNLTDKVFSIEIIKALFERTGGVYASLIGQGYSEYKAITRKNADGYYGWAEAAPFDKIIVTCGIDHVPPPLLQQLKPGGLMVIPIGPPGAQHVLKVIKSQGSDGTMSVARSDIYGGAIINFVPFTKLDGDQIKGTHSG